MLTKASLSKRVVLDVPAKYHEDELTLEIKIRLNCDLDMKAYK